MKPAISSSMAWPAGSTRAFSPTALQGDVQLGHQRPAHACAAACCSISNQRESQQSDSVFPVDALGNVGTTPVNVQDGSSRAWCGIWRSICRTSGRSSRSVTINFGGRFDVADAYDHENQLSPRHECGLGGHAQIRRYTLAMRATSRHRRSRKTRRSISNKFSRHDQ